MQASGKTPCGMDRQLPAAYPHRSPEFQSLVGEFYRPLFRPISVAADGHSDAAWRFEQLRVVAVSAK